MLDTKRLITLDDNLLFDIDYEKTRLASKKYVINKQTDKPIGIVGNSFNTTSHKDFIDGVEKVIKDNRNPYELSDAKVKVSTAKDNAVIIADITLPNVTTTVTTDKHTTTKAERIIADIIKNIVKSDRKAEKMNILYQNEVINRGSNVFSLYSAFTNYSSYADERNGFKLKEMGNDTASLSMWNREQEVSKWISSNEFKKLELVA